MADNLTKEQRSYIMSRIRSKWTEQEKKVHNHLKALKIKHKTHPEMKGSPDIILTGRKTVVFLHGCFWHKCSKHYKAPRSNTAYWLPKIDKNVARDRENIRLLKRDGWKVLRIWEHDMTKNFEKALEKIQNGV